VFGFIGLDAETLMQTAKTAVMQESRLVKVIFFFLLSWSKTVSTLQWKKFSKSQDLILLYKCHDDIYFTPGMTVLASSGFP